MTKRQIVAFQKKVYAHYVQHGRDFPWRHTKNPYRVLVSEIMLQQTQADRVVAKYASFLAQFPTVHLLAAAPLSAVLRAWQGLGYNRRARMLHRCAQTIVLERAGRFPKTHEELMALPGIGHYTAGAIMAFAYNIPVPIIETNIRTVYLHHFFPDTTDIADRELMPLIEETLDRENSRTWYAALMAYGVHLKKTYGNPSRRSVHHVRQVPFGGSDRQIRGAIVRALAGAEAPWTLSAILATVAHEPARVKTQTLALVREGLIERVGRRYRLAD